MLDNVLWFLHVAVDVKEKVDAQLSTLMQIESAFKIQSTMKERNKVP
jgi:hypothetical protein